MLQLLKGQTAGEKNMWNILSNKLNKLKVV